MSLDLDYFKKQMHINDLQNLNEKELKFIIPLLQDELEEFNNLHGFKPKGLIKAYEKIFTLFKDYRYIIYGYNYAIEKYKLSFCNKTDTERLVNNIETIFNNLPKIKAVRVSKEKINDLVGICLLNLRVFYDSIDEYITEEYNIWEAELSKQE